jgi:G3E family GTPase
MQDTAIPVTVLTGFLGSGKTTVLNHLLRQPELAGALVIINEFGEIGLDHLLIEVAQEQFALLDNGCICCTVRGDLVETLKDILARCATGDLQRPHHILIETTGLADPAPILHTFIAEADLAAAFRINGVATTIDAVNGWSTLQHHGEAAKQIAVADLLLVTKSDLVSNETFQKLEDRLSALAPMAKRLIICDGSISAAEIIEVTPLHDAADPAAVARWFARASLPADTHDHAQHRHDETCREDCGHHHHHHEEDSHHGIRSYSFIIDQPVEWSAFAQWLDYVTALKGEDLLRMKGMIQVTDRPEQPLVVHGVQHVFHPPVRLAAWPSDDRRTRLVFIVRNIDRETIERTLMKFAAIDAKGADIKRSVQTASRPTTV